MTTRSFTTFDTATAPATDTYKLLTGLVVPRPIGWVGTTSPSGTANVAPFSFFNAVSHAPPTVIFSIGLHQRMKDTAANLRATGEFSLSIVNEDLAPAMNMTAYDTDPDESEFDLTGITATPATAVKAPLVAEAPAHLECRVSQYVEIGPDDGPTSNLVVFGEVLLIHVDAAILDGTRIRHDVLRPVGRLAGNGYSTVADTMYELIRPDR